MAQNTEKCFLREHNSYLNNLKFTKPKTYKIMHILKIKVYFCLCKILKLKILLFIHIRKKNYEKNIYISTPNIY